MKLTMAELGLLTLQDFENLCKAWVEKPKKNQQHKGVQRATQEQLKKIFPR